MKVTTILATNQHEEAFELGDQIGIMGLGRLLEVGEPRQLYHCPQTEFGASLLGTANLLLGESRPSGVRLGPYHFDYDEPPRLPALDDAQRVQVLLRPEDLDVAHTRQELKGAPLYG
jgi:ABC-type Fe3+/spermidine/putrescine transport system ATPase subunit